MIIEGTTPIHYFEIPFDVSDIKEIKITYAQNEAIILEKRTDDCTLSGKMISCKLSQEDTFKFDGEADVDIQVRVLTNNDEALASIPEKVGVCKCLDTEVLT